MHYKMILEGEVPVNHAHLSKLFKKKEVFVLGYGSLLYASGWWSRGMGRVPREEDLFECTVEGYERGTFGLYTTYNRGWGDTGLHFYGVVSNNKCYLNGVLVKVHSLKDWANLMATECIAGLTDNYNYRCVDVTDKVKGIKLKKNQVVHMVVNESQNKVNWKNYVPAPKYYKRVAAGVEKERSDEFKKEFYATGGLTPKQAKSIYKVSRTDGWW